MDILNFLDFWGGREWSFFAESFFLFFYYFINALISALHISSLYCCLHLYLAHSFILLYFDVFFSPPEQSTFGHPKPISSHSF